MFRIAVLASTNGTDLQAIIDEIKNGTLEVELSVVIGNRECFAVERAKNQGFHALVIPSKGKDRAEFDQELITELEKYNVNLIVLVGYMRLFSPVFVTQYAGRIINVHPSLLPKYPGMDRDVYQEVLEAGEKETGMTIHFVDEGMDTGEIILQKKVTIADDDTVESLRLKVQALEKKWYPRVIEELSKKL